MGSTGRRWVALAATAGVVMSPLAYTAAPAQADPRDGAKAHLVRTSTSAAEKRLADAYEGTDTGDYVDPNQTTEPASNGTVKQATWQDWTTVGGKWHAIEGPGVPADSFVTLAQYLAAKPDATLAKDTMAGANQTYAKLGFDRIAAEVGDQTYLWDLEPEAGGLVDTGLTPIQHAIDGAWNSSAYDYAGNGGAGVGDAGAPAGRVRAGQAAGQRKQGQRPDRDR
jgi:hypothetical protein